LIAETTAVSNPALGDHCADRKWAPAVLSGTVDICTIAMRMSSGKLLAPSLIFDCEQVLATVL
jgi:hypothetical protein